MGSLIAMLANTVSTIPIADNLPALQQGVDWILVQMNGWFGSFAWTMIIFTILLKIVLFPLDYISRRSMKRNGMIQERLAPQLQKLEKQCKGDKQVYNQKMMVLMRKDGYKLSGACLPSLITFALFFYIFSALGSYTSHMNARYYNDIVVEYNTILVEKAEADGTFTVNEDGTKTYSVDENYMKSPDVLKQLTATYKKINPSWGWIKNTIRPDGFNTAIPTYDEITSSGVGSPGIGDFIAGGGVEEKRENYNRVMGFTKDADGNNAMIEGSIAFEYNQTGFKIFGKYLNGWFLLPILAAGVSFLSQFLTQKMQGSQAPGQSGGMMKAMMVIFPVMMLFFAVSYTSGFALYIITNSCCTLGGTFLMNWLAGKSLTKEFAKKDAAKNQASYRR